MTTCTASCRFCDKQYKAKSKWIPGDILDLSIEWRHIFHVIFRHFKECSFKNLTKSFLKTLWDSIKCIGIIILLIIKLLLYPIYLLLSLLYE